MNQISLCMIVKNEEAHLADCLGSISKYVDEIIIVDTGSSDRTKKIALGFTDKVYDFTWVSDFAKARNYAVDKASNEYILSLDADEITEEIDKDTILQLIDKNPDKIGRILLVNQFTRNGVAYQNNVRLARLFSKKHYKFQGAVHEQLIPVKDRLPEYYNVSLRVLHLGYEGDLDTRKRKTERNITLLLKALELNPVDPYILYQLGKSYYMQEDYVNAAIYFEEALSIDLNPELEYVQDMVECYGYSLLNSQQYEKAKQLLNVYAEFSVTADFIFLIALILMNDGQFQLAIEEFLKATTNDNYSMEGVNSYLAYFNVAVIYECMGNLLQAKHYYEKCSGYEPARKRLSEIEKSVI